MWLDDEAPSHIVVELLDALAEIGLHHLDADAGHVITQAGFLGQHRFGLDEILRPMIGKDAMDDAVVLGPIPRPVDVDAVGPRLRLELLEIVAKVRERVLLDGRCQLAQLLPFDKAVHLPVTLLAQVPEAFVMHLRMARRIDETHRRLVVIDGLAVVKLRSAWLGLGCGRAQRPGCSLTVAQPLATGAACRAVIGRVQFLMEQGRQTILCAARFIRSGHAASPFSTWAIWRNLSGSPSRSAQPF